MTKIGRFLRGFSLVDFSAVGFLGLLKTFKTQRQKVMFLYKSDFHWQSNAFPNSWFYLSRRKCIIAMLSCFKTKSEKNLTREVYLLARCLYMPQKHEIYGFFLQFFESLCGKFYKKMFQEMKNGLSLKQQQLQVIMYYIII